MTDSQQFSTDTIKLYRTGEHDCSYLKNRKSRTLFLDPELDYPVELYEELTQSGFRRSGQHLYRPDCLKCSSCIPARIPVKDFNMKRRFKRVMGLNKDLIISIHKACYREEDYTLFARYIEQRHSDGDMYPTSIQSYQDFLVSDTPYALHIRMTLNDKLVAVAVTDRLMTGLSAIYTFFDPELDKRSIGVFSILSQIELCKKWSLPYLYLGYWVPGCQKMQYKTNYQPTELLINEKWQLIIHNN